MDEERGLGNILFYVIAAIIAIVSAIKKKKDLPQGQTGTPEAEERPVGFPEGMFDDMEDSAYQDDYVQDEEILTPAQGYQSGMEGVMPEPMAVTFSGEGVSALGNIETEKSLEKLLSETATIYQTKDAEIYDYDTIDEGGYTLDEEFDARKAVIWSEIISRKEY